MMERARGTKSRSAAAKDDQLNYVLEAAISARPRS
jgi:hypothetical protein